MFTYNFCENSLKNKIKVLSFFFCTMAPGAFGILGPLLRRKKKYEKLETEDPEKKKNQEASHDEIERLNNKIDKLVTSLSRDDLEPALNPDEECIVCNKSKAVMEVAPCGHQCQCRICFIFKIQEAVESRDLPLRCLICNVKIFRVKNNSRKRNMENNSKEICKSTSKNSIAKSISGYSIVLGVNDQLTHSESSYSISSGISNISTSSKDSKKSMKSTSSWFSLGSLSSFQANGGCLLINKNVLSKSPRAHSIFGGQKTQNKSTNTKFLQESSLYFDKQENIRNIEYNCRNDINVNNNGLHYNQHNKQSPKKWQGKKCQRKNGRKKIKKK
ncbi:uncharacterized protein [Lepeophtheirus salmonis]|uniref:uncharacterized protein isoform X2 n=1 Tax=Lepeophtheirus salmonis TaxID=72036 RepID=UPI001AE6D361|nr:uncharacterized protein LOC121126982 isoform X2 [Lepeophtheirus salmonis]